MKNLINKITGQVITIDKIKDNGIAYNVYENGIYAVNGVNPIKKDCQTYDKNLVPNFPMSASEIIEFSSLEKIMEFENGFEISDRLTNWSIEIGSTGTITKYRVVIPYTIIGIEISKVVSAFADLLIEMRPLEAFRIASETCICQYLEDIKPTDLILLKSFENKGVIVKEREL